MQSEDRPQRWRASNAFEAPPPRPDEHSLIAGALTRPGLEGLDRALLDR
jgi:hypothetical protein